MIAVNFNIKNYKKDGKQFDLDNENFHLSDLVKIFSYSKRNKTMDLFMDLGIIIVSNYDFDGKYNIDENKTINVIKNRYGQIGKFSIGEFIKNNQNINLEIKDFDPRKKICMNCDSNYTEDLVCQECLIELQEKSIDKKNSLENNTDLYLNCKYNISNNDLDVINTITRIKNEDSVNLYFKIKEFIETK